MLAKRVRPLVASDLATECSCPGPCPLRDSGLLRPDAAWARSAIEYWGICGVAAYDGDHLVGRLLFCPTLATPPGHPLAGAVRTPDGALVMQLWVDPDHRLSGIGRQLVQSACAHLVGSAPSLAAAATGGRPGTVACCQILPMEWLAAAGFQRRETVRGVTRMVLELDQTVRWRPQLKWAWARVAEWVGRPAAPPEPSGGLRLPLAERAGELTRQPHQDVAGLTL